MSKNKEMKPKTILEMKEKIESDPNAQKLFQKGKDYAELREAVLNADENTSEHVEEVNETVNNESHKDDAPNDNEPQEQEQEQELAPKPLSIEKFVDYTETFLKKVDKEIEEFDGQNAREVNLMAINVRKTLSSLRSSVKFLNECLKQPE